ncbi:MAG: tetratricopeptide repeat protein [Herpetosiphonaceae bacterium]|nr:tetratricopeptide repeat protein [Herpetosiphonaceae bacterium]
MQILSPTASEEPWVAHYLRALLAEPTLQPVQLAQPLWLEQQLDPVAERQGEVADGQSSPALRVTVQNALDRSGGLLLFGGAGSGKSTLVRQLVRQLAEEAVANSQAPLPLYIPLAYFSDSIEASLAAQARRRGPALAELVLRRRCVLLIDALSDLQPSEQMTGLATIRRAINTVAPHGRWLIACRSESWSLFEAWFQALGAPPWRIRPWTDAQVASALEPAMTTSGQRLLKFPGAVELARRPRWLHALQHVLKTTTRQELPGPLLIKWYTAVAAEAAEAHYLPFDETMLRPLLQRMVQRLEQMSTLHHNEVVSIARDFAQQNNVQAADTMALIEAIALLETRNGESYELRSPLLADLAYAYRNEISTVDLSRKAPWALALRCGIGAGNQIVDELIAAEAWRAIQGVLDANLEPQQILDHLPALSDYSTIALGRVWAQYGSRDVAIRLLRRVLNQGHDDPQLWGLLGQLLQQSAQLVEAQAAFTEALRTDPTNLHYQQALAQVCRDLGEADTATATLEHLLSEHHRQLAATAFTLGQMYEDRQQLTQARDHFRRAAMLVPNEGNYVLALARTLRLLGEGKEASRLLRDLDVQGIATAGVAAEVAELLLQAGQDSAALKQLERVEAMGQASATTYIQIAGIEERNGRADAARRAYQAALDYDPQSVTAYRGLLQLALQDDEQQTALSAAQRLADLLPTDGATWTQLGMLQRLAGRLPEALRTLTHAEQSGATSTTGLELARTYWALGDHGRAAQHYRTAAHHEAEPQIVAEAGWALLEVGDLATARSLLERARAALPSDGRIAYDLGRCLEQQGSLQLALDAYSAAATLSTQPSQPVLLAQARVARLLNDMTLARHTLALAVLRARHSPNAWAEAGRLHLQMQQPVHAVRAFRRIPLSERTPIVHEFAGALLDIGAGAEALPLLQALPQNDPSVQLDLSRAYGQIGNPETALRIARAAAAQQPRNAHLQHQMGRMALQSGHIEEALAAFETAHVHGAGDPEVLLDISRALLAANRPQEALQAVQTTLRSLPSAQAHIQHGRVLLQMEDAEAAQLAFEQALCVDKHRPEAWSGLAHALEARLGPGRVIPYVEQAQRLAPGDQQHALHLGRLFLEDGEPQRAQAVLQPLAGTSLRADRLRYAAARDLGKWTEARAIAASYYDAVPDHPECQADLGIALLRTGEAQAAVDVLRRASSAEDAHPTWLTALGEALLQIKQPAEAIKALQPANAREPKPERLLLLAEALEATGQRPAALHALNQALTMEGDHAPIQRALARLYTADEALDDALRAWEVAAALAPDDREAALALANLHLQRGSPEAIVDQLEAFLAEHPEDAGVWAALAQSALAAGHVGQARHAAAVALHHHPQSPALRALLARAEHASGNTVAAVQALQPIIEHGQADIPTLLLMYQVAAAAGDQQLAQRSIEEAAQRDRYHPEVLRVLAQHIRAAGDPQRALRMLRDAVKAQPRDAGLWGSLAEYAFEQNELADARHAIDQALLLKPDDVRYQRLRGEIAFRTGDGQRARHDFERVSQGRPVDAQAALRLGQLAFQRGEWKEAVRLGRIASQEDSPEAQGTLALALRRPYEPVSEDEVPGQIDAPQLAEARDILARIQDHTHWGSEYGWTLLLAGATTAAVPLLERAAQDTTLSQEDQANAARHLGIAHLKLGNTAAATQALEVADRRQATAATASLLGQAREAQGDVPLAVQFYARAAAQQPEWGPHHLRLGTALLRTGSVTMAYEHLVKATKLDQARPAAWTARSAAELGLQKLNDAWVSIQRAVQIDRTNAEAWYQMAQVAGRRDDVSAMLQAWERAVAGEVPQSWLLEYADVAIGRGRLDRGIQMLRRASEREPGNGKIWYRLSRLHTNGERIRLLEQALAVEPSMSAWRTELAQLQAEHGQHDVALEQLQVAVTTPDAGPETWAALARTQAQVGDTLTAEATLEAAIERYPNVHILHTALATLLNEQGRWVEALTAYNRAARSATSQATIAAAEAGRGHCMLQLGRTDEARLAAEQALARDTTNVAAALVLAELALQNQDWKTAAKYAGQAREQDDTSLEACYLEAEADIQLRWLDQANQAIEEGLAIEPHFAELHRLRAAVLFERRSYDAAEKAVHLAIEYDPESAEAYYLQGQIFRAQKRWLEALTALRKAVKLNRNFREAIQLLMSLGGEAVKHGVRL